MEKRKGMDVNSTNIRARLHGASLMKDLSSTGAIVCEGEWCMGIAMRTGVPLLG